jgi:hypothetical protein
VIEALRSHTAVDFAKQQQRNLQQAKYSLIHGSNTQKKLFDRQHPPHNFTIAASVYFDPRNFRTTCANNTEERSRKLQDRFAGPFETVAASSLPNACVLNTLEAWKMHQPFNVSRFTKDTSDRSRKQHPPVMVRTARGSEYIM